ncbi:MAG: hypothetical protein HAW59_05965, partial [Betaproteobacteria bacterium]|nr:hypothetical protein [Betaproteobacteria bacterium]
SREINCTSDAGTVGGIRFSQSCPFIFLIENAFAEVIRGAPPGAPLVTVMASGGGGAASYTYSLENAPAELMIESTIGMGILRHTAIFSELTTASFDIVAASGTETARATFTVEVVLPSPVGLDVQPAAAQITVAVESGILATAAASGGLGSDSYEYTLADNPPQITINATSGIIGFSAPFTVLNSVQALNITNFNIIVESRSSLMPRGEGQLATVSFRTEVVSPEDLALRVEPVAVQITAGVASGILATARASGGLGTASYVYSLGEEPPQVAIDAASGEISFNAPFVLNAERALNITNFNVIVESTSTIVLSGIRQFATVSFRTETLPEELEISVTPDDTTVRTSIAVGVIAEAAVLGGRPPYRYSLDNAPAQIGIGGDSAAATVSLVSEFTTTLTYTVGVVVRDSDNLLATATLMFRTVNEAGLDIMPTMVRATAGFPVPRDLASAQVLGGEVGVNYTYGLTEVNNAPARLELDADADGGTVRLTSTYLLAEVGNQEYRITANGDNDPTLQFTMTLTVAVQPTPELNLNLSEDSVRLPVGVGNRELSRATASGGLGSGYTYSITRNGLPSDLGIDSTSGVIRYNGLAALDGGGNAPQGSADIIVASGELRTTMALTFSVWDITVNNAAAEVRDRESVGGNILPTIMIINPQGRTY